MKLLRVDAKNLESVVRVALLAEHTYQPSQTGKLEEAGEHKIPFTNHFAFTLRCYAQAGGMPDDEIAKFFGDNGFNLLRRVKKVRDRLVHPKKRDDLDVSEGDLLEVTNALNWSVQFISEIENRIA